MAASDRKRSSVHMTPTEDDDLHTSLESTISTVCGKRGAREGASAIWFSTSSGQTLFYADPRSRDKFTPEEIAHVAHTLQYGSSMCNDYSIADASVKVKAISRSAKPDSYIVIPKAVVNDIHERGNVEAHSGASLSASAAATAAASSLEAVAPNPIMVKAIQAHDYPSVNNAEIQAEVEALFLEGLCP